MTCRPSGTSGNLQGAIGWPDRQIARIFLLTLRLLEVLLGIRARLLDAALQGMITESRTPTSIDDLVERETGTLHATFAKEEDFNNDEVAANLEKTEAVAREAVQQDEGRTRVIETKSMGLAGWSGTSLTMLFGIGGIALANHALLGWALPLLAVLYGIAIVAFVAAASYAARALRVSDQWRGPEQAAVFNRDVLHSVPKRSAYMAIYFWNLYRANKLTTDRKADALDQGQALFVRSLYILLAMGIILTARLLQHASGA